MGVYINMEMPKKTYVNCMLIKDIDDSVQLHVCTKNSEEISEWEFYDLVPVPAHGRLIDADALRDRFYEDYFRFDAETIVDYIRANAPTIIPASGEGLRCNH